MCRVSFSTFHFLKVGQAWFSTQELALCMKSALHIIMAPPMWEWVPLIRIQLHKCYGVMISKSTISFYKASFYLINVCQVLFYMLLYILQLIHIYTYKITVFTNSLSYILASFKVNGHNIYDKYMDLVNFHIRDILEL